MSKGNLFLSQARGKVGSVVFYRANGEQITRVYTSQVKNPKSYAQGVQRALFSSVSQYYKAFKYLIEQGQESVSVGNASVRKWQSDVLRLLSAQVNNSPMLLNKKGWQFPQGLPISLTNGTLQSIDYSIRLFSAASGNRYLTLDFNGSFVTSDGLLAMTLGDFYNLYGSISRGSQFTTVMAFHGDGMDVSASPLNYETVGVWNEFVISPDADESLRFFVPISGSSLFEVNPAILQGSWGGNISLAFSPISIIEDGSTHYGMAVIPQGLVGDGSICVAGSVITSYYDGSRWARSYSPMAVSWTESDMNEYIATYMSAAQKRRSALYLNQSEVQTTENARVDNIEVVVSGQAFDDSQSSNLVQDEITVLGTEAELSDINNVAINIFGSNISPSDIVTTNNNVSLGPVTVTPNGIEIDCTLNLETILTGEPGEVGITFRVGNTYYRRDVIISLA